MKRKRITNYLKTGILLLGTSALLWNCEKDIELIEEAETLNASISIKQLSVKELKTDNTFNKVVSTFGFENHLLEDDKKRLHNKGTVDFEVDVNSVRKVTRNGYTSYTFYIKRHNAPKNITENLVLENKNDTIKGYIMKYKDAYYEENDGMLSLKTKMLKTPYQDNLTALLSSLNINFQQKFAPDCYTDGFHSVRVCSVHGAFSTNPNCNNFKNDTYWDYNEKEICLRNDDGYADLSSEGGSGGSSGNGGSSTSPIIPCLDIIHGCDKGTAELADRLGVDDSLLSDLPELALNKLEELATLNENLSFVIDSPSFDGLNDSWFKTLREFAKKLEQAKNIISKNLYNALTFQLDSNLKNALNRVAKQLSVRANIIDEVKKEQEFMYSGKDGVAILLYEFANGTGKDKRDFPYNYDMTKQMIAGNVQNDIKADFLKVINNKGITFDQFIANGALEGGSYRFSPDHTGIVDSFNKHVNANWVQFFIGGASTKYSPSADPGFIIVELTNNTSRKSLLLHVGNNYERDGTGVNKGLSTIKQIFRFKLKIQ